MKNMKNYITKLFAGAALLSLILAGCSSLKEDGGSLKREIKFSASVGTFQVKATDTAFESGDQVGLFADYPVSASNVRLTWQNGALTPDSPIYWGESQALDEATDFLAYYPYIEGQSGRGIEIFSVQADQTTHEAYTASDLMIAETISAPEDGTVDLNFIHRMTKLVLHIENRVDNRAVASVTVGNVYGSVSGSLASGSSLWCTGDPMVIKAGKVTTATGESAWTLIMAPEQNTRPSIIITMEDGEEFVYEADNEIWFVPARCYNAYVTIDAASVTTDFTSNVTDWYNGGEFWFGQHTSTPYGGVWSMIGTIEGTNWDTDLEMKQIDNGVWRRSWVAYHEGEEFKFRMDGSWDVNFGADSDFYMQDGYSYALLSYGENFKIERSGYYSVYLDLNYMCAYVIYKDELPSEFTWDYTASREYYMDSNLWLPVDRYCSISWYYAPGWNQIDNPEVTFTESTYEFTLPEATTDRWQAQMWIVPGEDLILSSDKTYTMTFTMATTSTFEFLVKFYEYGNDTNSSFDFTFRSEANNVMPYQFSFMGLDAPERLLFDFGTAPAGTKVYIKDITIKDDSAYELDQIQPIVDSEDGTVVEFTQVVYAICTRGFIVFDGKYSIFVYTVNDPGVCVGDVVSVSGTKTHYNNAPEISQTSWTVLDHTGDVMDLTYYYNDVSTYLDQGFADISIPISVEGVLQVDGYTLAVDGQTTSCNIYYAPQEMGIANLVGHKLKVSGFYNGRNDSKQLVYIIATLVEDMGIPEVPGEIYGSWSLIGTINGTSWDKDFVMESDDENYPGIRTYLLTYNAGEEFKLRKTGDWSENFGIGNSSPFIAYDQQTYDMLDGGANISLEKSGVWVIYADVINAKFTAYLQDDIPDFYSNVSVTLGDKAYNDNVLNVTYGSNVFEGVENVKLGTSKLTGSCSFVIPAGSTRLTFWAVGWKGNDTTLNFSIDGLIGQEGTPEIVEITAYANDGATSTSPYNLTVESKDMKQISFPASENDMVATITTVAPTYRAFIFGIQVK